ncbi:toll-like receptor Tollo [Uloborus diversus]|uniref:toll-like receptor Tollo n=1 Tax=Uloborus diversus TaxID=327109 RepID=UPI002409FD73|nr:toll-like receptor Tollo [Uloborus diversus]
MLQTVSFAYNSIRSIDLNFFQGTNNVEVLDLSHNMLVSIPSDFLNNLKNLEKLSLSYNQLLHLNNVFAKVYPKRIILTSNNLTDIDTILHAGMEHVETLILSHNPISSVSPTIFHTTIPRVETLMLDYCQISSFDIGPYELLSNLQVLDLGHNLIETIPKQKIAFGQHLELSFIGNRISKFDAELSTSVKAVYLSENRFQNLDRTLQFSRALLAEVAFNHLQILTADDFRGSRRLLNLNLCGNAIERIDTLTFLPLKDELNHLDLSFNSIKVLNGSVRYLTHLISLNLSSNFIMDFDEGEFTSLSELETLYLDNNHVVTLGQQFQQLPRLQYLDLRNNYVESLSQNELPVNLQRLDFKGNPFKCNCKILPFLKWLRTYKSPSTDVKLCSSADETQNAVHCPGPCSCECTGVGNESFMTVNCSSRYMSMLPPFLTGDSRYWHGDNMVVSQYTRRETPLFYIHDEVRFLDLENNFFQSLNGARLPAGLRRLHLSGNILSRLPDHFLYALPKLEKLTLSRNPWSCGCGVLSMKTWLKSKSELVPDVNSTFCFSQGALRSSDSTLLLSFPDKDLCPRKIITYLLIGSAVIGCISLFILGFIVYTRRRNSQWCLRTHSVTWTKCQDSDDCIYDAFVSFSDMEADIVYNEFISTLESQIPGIRVYFPDRIIFPPSATVRENTLAGLKNSRRAIIFLSRNFLMCPWCTSQLLQANFQRKEKQIEQLIVIEVGDLPKDIDSDLKESLRHSIRLQWGHKNFWCKLFNALKTNDEVKTSLRHFFKTQNSSADEDSVPLMKSMDTYCEVAL